MLASIIYNYGKFCDDFKSTLKLGAYLLTATVAAKKAYKLDYIIVFVLPYVSFKNLCFAQTQKGFCGVTSFILGSRGFKPSIR